MLSSVVRVKTWDPINQVQLSPPDLSSGMIINIKGKPTNNTHLVSDRIRSYLYLKRLPEPSWISLGGKASFPQYSIIYNHIFQMGIVSPSMSVALFFTYSNTIY